MKTFNVIVTVVFLGVVGFIAWNLIEDSKKKYYSTILPENKCIEEKLQLSGFIYPSTEIDIKPQLSGVIDAIFKSTGDMVNEGDPIASISLVSTSEEIDKLTSNVNVAKISLNAAETKFKRQKMLLEKKAIPNTEFEADEKEYLTAKENYQSAVNQLHLRKKGGKSGNNIVCSSANGIVINIPLKSGASVIERSSYNEGTTIATVASSNLYVFSADVAEKNIGSICIGTQIEISIPAYKNLDIAATVTKISSKGNMVNGAVKFPVEAQFSIPSDSLRLLSGCSAIGEVLISKVENAMSLPEKCINFKGDTVFVYVLDSLGNNVMQKDIQIGISDGNSVQVTSGLTRNDPVITNYHD